MLIDREGVVAVVRVAAVVNRELAFAVNRELAAVNREVAFVVNREVAFAVNIDDERAVVARFVRLVFIFVKGNDIFVNRGFVGRNFDSVFIFFDLERILILDFERILVLDFALNALVFIDFAGEGNSAVFALGIALIFKTFGLLSFAFQNRADVARDASAVVEFASQRIGLGE